MLKKISQKGKPIHVFVILLFLVFLASILTYCVPAGEFDRVLDEVSGQTIVVADSYKTIANNPIAPWKIPEMFYKAITSETAAGLIFFIFIIGGSFEIIMSTGSLTALCESVLYYFQKRKTWIIPVFISLFSIFGFTMGLATAAVIFVPIGIAASKTLGFDKLTGTAMVALGTNAGFAAGIFNPFSVGIAQSIAEVPLYSGAWIRVLLLVALIIATSAYLMRYAAKYDRIAVSENGNMVGIDLETEKVHMTVRQKIVLIEFIILFGFITYGVTYLKFDTSNLAVTFMVMGVVTGLTAGFTIYEVCELFTAGCKKMVKGSLVIGIAATLRLVLTEGNILDTITYQLTGLIYYVPHWAQLTGMFYANAAIDLLITSGSSHAAVVMPIMTPMADFLGLSRQSAVFAFQLGDGLVNLTSPISTTLTGILAVSELSYGKWFKFFIPLVGIYMIIGTIFMILAGVAGY